MRGYDSFKFVTDYDTVTISDVLYDFELTEIANVMIFVTMIRGYQNV